MTALLQNLDALLIYVFAAFALVGAVLMLVLRQPMRVAVALISTMISLGAIYGLMGVHFIAAFQVLIYVGAVMLFMVYAIMLLEAREAAPTRRYSALALPGAVVAAVLVGVLGYGAWHGFAALAGAAGGARFGIQQFSASFLNEYWLHFELTSVLLVAAVVAALAVIKVSRRTHG